MLQPDFAGALAADLDHCPEAGRNRLQIEIVETAALKDLDVVRQMIEDCRKLGVTFSLDDFGTGYSTLAHIRHLPVSEIKIDQSFVRQMLTRPEDLAIVEAVIRLGRAFGRSLVAEGVETPAHIKRLLAMGCDVMQGYAARAADAGGRYSALGSRVPAGSGSGFGRPAPRSAERPSGERKTPMRSSAPIQWNDAMLTGVAAIDRQHRILVDSRRRRGSS